MKCSLVNCILLSAVRRMGGAPVGGLSLQEHSFFLLRLTNYSERDRRASPVLYISPQVRSGGMHISHIKS